MARLSWDSAGLRSYEVGLDRGVLYTTNGTGFVWNGLRSVSEDASSASSTPLYFDGKKYFDSPGSSDYSGTIEAITYPDEFLEFDGYQLASDGMFFANQKRNTFSISYRTYVGNDIGGMSARYKLHIIYDLTADPSAATYQTLSETIDPIIFSWRVNSTPQNVEGYLPVSHIVLDSKYMSDITLATVEDILYGTATTTARLPSALELLSIVNNGVGYVVIDNGDGTWTAIGSDLMISMIDSTIFQITNARVTYLDANTYQIS